MAGLKEIRRRLHSVRNTKKITYAMKLVSAAKLRRAQEAVVSSRQYTGAINQLLSEVLAENESGNYSHPLLERRAQVKRIGALVVGGSRGLCGGYNANVNKRIEALIREKGPSAQIDWFLLGRKPAEYFRRTSRKYVQSYEQLSEEANRWPIDEVAFELESRFLKQELDEVYMIYTRFRSAISMSVICERIIPLDADLASGKALAPSTGLTLFEPSALEVFRALMPRILRTKIRQAALDAKASEYGSRMTAMDSATKNAGELIDKLQLTHNKLRQGGITSELLDIIGGAEAIS